MDWSSLLEGFKALADDPGTLIMLVIGGVLIYLGIARKFEPLILIGIGVGIILANLPLAELVKPATDAETGGLLWYFQEYLLATEIIPLLIFLGLGALTDFEPMLSNPRTILLGAAAQLGVFIALLGAIALDFDLRGAASIAIIGGADGPTTIYVATKMQEMGGPLILGAVAVAAYSYMALVPVIQPPIIRLLTTKEERRVRMPYTFRPVSRRTKIIFPIALAIVGGIIVPRAVPLLGMLAFGNLLRESGVVERLSSTAQNELMNIVTILLGLTVGSTMPAAIFLQWGTIQIFLLGLIAFGFSTAGGVLLGKLMYRLSGKRINPIIGAAGVSAVPMAARVAQSEASREDPENFLLMHAMGPNVAGVIGTATVAGVLIALVPGMIG
ncbi:MAG: sodium ion-translocating decarboxylase subunit beta, partial [Dehalococcoidia bacterium]